jgi:hypothetical protein
LAAAQIADEITGKVMLLAGQIIGFNSLFGFEGHECPKPHAVCTAWRALRPAEALPIAIAESDGRFL